MLLVAGLAELMEEYTALVTRLLEQVVADAPLPRRIRLVILRSLPFASPPPPQELVARNDGCEFVLIVLLCTKCLGLGPSMGVCCSLLDDFDMVLEPIRFTY